MPFCTQESASTVHGTSHKNELKQDLRTVEHAFVSPYCMAISYSNTLTVQPSHLLFTLYTVKGKESPSLLVP